MKNLRNLVVGCALAFLSISASAIPTAGIYELLTSHAYGVFTSDGHVLTDWDFTSAYEGRFKSATDEVVANDATKFHTRSYGVDTFGFNTTYTLELVWSSSLLFARVCCQAFDSVSEPLEYNRLAAVPTPATILLFGLGLAGIAVTRKTIGRRVSH